MFSEIIDVVSVEEREHKNKQCGQKEGLFNMQQVNFMVTPCSDNIQHFDIQYTLTQCKVHTPQVTICSHNTDNVLYEFYTLTQCTVHTPHRSQYAAITLTTSCTASTYFLLTKCVTFS